MKVSPRDAFYRCWMIGLNVVQSGLLLGLAVGVPVASPWLRLGWLATSALSFGCAIGFLISVKENYLK